MIAATQAAAAALTAVPSGASTAKKKIGATRAHQLRAFLSSPASLTPCETTCRAALSHPVTSSSLTAPDGGELGPHVTRPGGAV